MNQKCKCDKEGPEWEMRFFCRSCKMEIDPPSVMKYIDWLEKNSYKEQLK